MKCFFLIKEITGNVGYDSNKIADIAKKEM